MHVAIERELVERMLGSRLEGDDDDGVKARQERRLDDDDQGQDARGFGFLPSSGSGLLSGRVASAPSRRCSSAARRCQRWTSILG